MPTKTTQPHFTDAVEAQNFVDSVTETIHQIDKVIHSIDPAKNREPLLENLYKAIEDYNEERKEGHVPPETVLTLANAFHELRDNQTTIEPHFTDADKALKFINETINADPRPVIHSVISTENRNSMLETIDELSGDNQPSPEDILALANVIYESQHPDPDQSPAEPHI